MRCHHKNKKLVSVIVSENGKLKKLTGKLAIDATGDADIAFFAGENYQHGNSRTGITQNYSQWDISGRINVPSNTNRDYDIIDNTKYRNFREACFSRITNLTFTISVRCSLSGNRECQRDLHDHHKRCVRKETLQRYHCPHEQRLRSHYTGSSEFSRCGFLLPHSNKTIVEIPFRSIVPASVDGLLLSGRGISQTNNAMQFTRMSGDVCTLGYITGQIASDISSKAIETRITTRQNCRTNGKNWDSCLPKRRNQRIAPWPKGRKSRQRGYLVPC